VEQAQRGISGTSKTKPQPCDCCLVFSYLRVFLFSLVFALLAGTQLHGAILSGSVSFDSTTHLYIYSYTIANGYEISPANGLPFDIVELSVLVNSASSANVPGPSAHTEPGGWNFSSVISTASSPVNEFGRSWDWSGFSLGVPPFSNGVPPNTTLGGFSFTTDREPSSGTGNNYFLYGQNVAGGLPSAAIVEYGRVVAPDFGVVPEPSTLILLSLGAFGLLARRR
jgi:hypothetical protein